MAIIDLKESKERLKAYIKKNDDGSDGSFHMLMAVSDLTVITLALGKTEEDLIHLFEYAFESTRLVDKTSDQLQ